MIPFACRCGSVRGTLDPSDGVHVRCFCRSCRGAARLAGAPDPKGGGVPLFQTSPHRMTIAQGRALLDPFRFGPRSIVRRWRATCCGDVLFSSGDGPFWGVIGPVDRILEDAGALGPERARAFLPPAREGGRARHEGAGRLLGALTRRTLSAQVTGAWRRDPLAPYPKARLATEEERAAAYGRAVSA